MPKVPSSLPISALFGIAKPSGPSSMSVINDIKILISSSRLFVDEASLSKQNSNSNKGKQGYRRRRDKGNVKIGQGGTLDPLADGVLVVGVGKGTKKLSQFLDCVKTYRTTALLGAETDSYDSDGSIVRLEPWKHVKKEKLEENLSMFRDEIYQVPPIFSALKMDGIPLYEYARQNKPLPRAIEKRKVTVYELKLEKWYEPSSLLNEEENKEGEGQEWRWPEKWVKEEDRQAMEKTMEWIEKSAESDTTISKDITSTAAAAADSAPSSLKLTNSVSVVESDGQPAPAFSLYMTVSSGTYVRCIVHDLARAVGSAAHVVALTRLRQGRFVLTSSSEDLSPPIYSDREAHQEDDMASKKEDVAVMKEVDIPCIPWDVWKQALEAEEKGCLERDEDGWCPWEREVMKYMEIVE